MIPSTDEAEAGLAVENARSVFPSFSAIFNRKMQKLPTFSCILIRNGGKIDRLRAENAALRATAAKL